MASYTDKIAALISGGVDSMEDITSARERGRTKAESQLNFALKFAELNRKREEDNFKRQKELVELNEKGYSYDPKTGSIFVSDPKKVQTNRKGAITENEEIKSLDSFLNPSTIDERKRLQSASPEEVDTATLRRREILGLPGSPSEIVVSGRQDEGVLRGVRSAEVVKNTFQEMTKLDPEFDKLGKKNMKLVTNNLAQMSKDLFNEDFLNSKDQDILEAKAALASGVSPSIVRRNLANALRIKRAAQTRQNRGIFQ